MNTELIEEIDGLETYKGKWRNLNVAKTGSFLGTIDHKTEADALRRSDEWLKKCKEQASRTVKDVSIQLGRGRHLYWFSDHLFIIPIPVGEES